jgi:TIR domain-containing protein
MSDNGEYEFDVALSFAGEDRQVAENLADGLRAAGVRVFYDRYEQVQLWGKDLYQHLQQVYRDRAKYCIIFVSQHYAGKLWPRHELKQAQVRAFQESREYILPLRLDDSELPGLNATVGYIDLRQHPLMSVQELILRKVFGDEIDDGDADELTWRGDLVEFRGDEVASFWPEKVAKAQEKRTYTVIKELPRVKYGDEPDFVDREGRVCHDCSAIPGEYHVPSCDMERCPSCGGQMIGCACIVEDD